MPASCYENDEISVVTPIGEGHASGISHAIALAQMRVRFSATAEFLVDIDVHFGR